MKVWHLTVREKEAPAESERRFQYVTEETATAARDLAELHGFIVTLTEATVLREKESV